MDTQCRALLSKAHPPYIFWLTNKSKCEFGAYTQLPVNPVVIPEYLVFPRVSLPGLLPPTHYLVTWSSYTVSLSGHLIRSPYPVNLLVYIPGHLTWSTDLGYIPGYSSKTSISLHSFVGALRHSAFGRSRHRIYRTRWYAIFHQTLRTHFIPQCLCFNYLIF